MAIGNQINYADINELYLDPLNPRLGRDNTGPNVSQEEVLELMKDWTLDELAVSFLESNFWVQEALLVTEEKLYGKKRKVVIEGNRRLAALQNLKNAAEGRAASKRWAEIVAIKIPPADLFTNIPYLLAESRKDIEAFLGFRHVTGIAQWKPAEKAEFIAKMIDENHMTYEDVMRRIGSKTPTVRQNYIAYRLLRQMEEQDEIAVQEVEKEFSVLFLALRAPGVQQYLQFDIRAEPKDAKNPVPRGRLKALANFALWLFGDGKRPPLFTDSRLVDKFGTILASQRAVEYLERTEKPTFDTAYRIAGGDEPELVNLVQGAADNIELALSRAHLYTKSPKLQTAVQRFGADAFQLLSLFPQIRASLEEEE